MNLKLSKIAAIPALSAKITGNLPTREVDITGISIDSRTIEKGSLFFAIKGDKYDAHQFVGEVLERGATAAVVNKEWYEIERPPGNFLIVDDTLNALQEMSHFYRQQFDIPLIAITGSNGKTTSKEMAVHVLSHKFTVLKTRGNLNNHIGVPLTLFDMDQEHTIAVIEMGCNHFNEITRLAEIAEPEYGLITNIGPAHLEFFKSLEGVAKAKTELWKYLEGKRGTAFINNDDPFLSRMMPADAKIVTYGFKNKSDVQGSFKELNDLGFPVFSVQDHEIKLQVAGEHNIYNALSAIAIGMEFGIDISDISEALQTFTSASKRMEMIKAGHITILNDCYNSNFISAERSLHTLSQIKTAGHRIAILSDMKELGDQSEYYHREIGARAAAYKIDSLLTFGQFSILTNQEAAKSGLKNAIHFKTKRELIEYLNKMVKKNDVILIKGSRAMAMEEVTEALLRMIER